MTKKKGGIMARPVSTYVPPISPPHKKSMTKKKKG